MSFLSFSSFKDSGSCRLGKVPAHWDVVSCRAIVDERVEKNSDGSIRDYLSLMANIGVIRYEDKGDVGNKKPDDLGKCKIVRKGNLVINSMNYGIGSYGLSAYSGVCSPVYIVLVPIQSKVFPRYALRIFEDKSFQSWAQSFGNGILAHRSAIGWDDLKNIKVPLPPIDEQKKLSQFLDHETAKIDALIAEQQRLIELLKEKRQTVISHAVTKGLSPNAPMKDSGVEWLGEVPAHWKVLSLRRVIQNFEQGWSPECFNYPALKGEWGVLKAGAVNNGVYREGENKALPMGLNPRGEIEVRKGDLIMCRASGSKDLIGSVAYVRETQGRLMLSDKLFRLIANKMVEPEFVAIVLGSKPLRRQIEQAINGAEGLANNLSQASVKEFNIVLPPASEQCEICKHIEGMNDEIGRLVKCSEEAVSLLSERRSALVSAAVTGKIDVRGWQPSESASAETVLQA